MSKKIVIRYDDDSLFGGGCTGIDQAASAARFGEMAEYAVQQVYPGAEIEIEYGPSMRGDEFRLDGVIDEDETENVKEITGEVCQSFQWVVYDLISLKAKAIIDLKEIVKPGDIIYTILRHEAKTTDWFALAVITDNEPLYITYKAADAMGYDVDPKYFGIKVGGYGFNKTDHLVSKLSYALYGNEHGLRSEKL